MYYSVFIFFLISNNTINGPVHNKWAKLIMHLPKKHHRGYSIHCENKTKLVVSNLFFYVMVNKVFNFPGIKIRGQDLFGTRREWYQSLQCKAAAQAMRGGFQWEISVQDSRGRLHRRRQQWENFFAEVVHHFKGEL